MNYYQLLPPESDNPGVGVAYASEETDTFAHPKDRLEITFTFRDGTFPATTSRTRIRRRRPHLQDTGKILRALERAGIPKPRPTEKRRLHQVELR